MELLMGIDLGTSSVKTLICDVQGNIIAVAAEDYDILSPQNGWAEQDPEMLWQATCRSIRAALQKMERSPQEIRGIGLSGQMHGLVALDGDGKPVRNTMIWADSRSSEEAEILNTVQAREQMQNTIAPGFFISSLAWLKNNEADEYSKIRTLLLPKDYIRYRLCAELGTDQTDASGTLVYNPATHQWAKDWMQAQGLDPSLLPKVHRSEEIAGTITPTAHEETGLAIGTPIVFGGADQPMQSVGNGIVKPGIFSSNIGTASQIACVVDHVVQDPLYRLNLFCFPGDSLWSLMGAGLNGGSVLKWLQKKLFASSHQSYSQLCDQAQNLPLSHDDPIFLPYLNGERSPHQNPHAKGILFGLTMEHDERHVTRAAMEGVIFALKDSLALFYELGLPCQKMVASGGGTRHPLWLQLQADIFERPVYRITGEEQACIGAAVMAGVGAGIYANIEEGCQELVSMSDDVVEPVLENQPIYAERYAKFQQLYQNNKALF